MDIIPDSESEYQWLEYSVQEEKDSIFISPNSGYFKEYISEKEMDICDISDGRDFIKNLNWECYIVNNSDDPLSVNKMRVNVQKSRIDSFPFIEISTSVNNRYKLCLTNQSWTNWGEMTLEYSFERKNQTFNGKYDHILKIPYFKDYALIDFRSDLITDGYDEVKLCLLYTYPSPRD